jgi:hypothetical protein
MPRPRTAFLATVAAGALLFLVLSLVRGTALTYTLGVPSNGVAVKLAPRKEFCQEPIVAESDRSFDRVTVVLGTYDRPGPALAVAIRDPKTRAVLAHATVPAGYPDITRRPSTIIALDHAIHPATLAVCFRNAGAHSVAFYGAGDAATPSTATLGGKGLGADVALSFSDRHHSWASTLGATFGRASLFRTPRIPGWLYLVGLVLLTAVAAATLTVAVSAALEVPPPSPDEP